MARAIALLGISVALTSCSGGATSPSPVVARAPIAQGSAPASASSATRATFTVHWPAAGEPATVRGRKTISPSTQSVSVSVNGGPGTVVNKPTISGSPATTSISISAAPGNDQFTFTAWDKPDASGAILDQSTVSQNIVADANNAVSVVLDGVCAALLPAYVSATAPYAVISNMSVPIASATRSVLQSARVIGPNPLEVAFAPVDADGNTILTQAGTAPISVQESGTTPHVTIAPVASGASNTAFTLTPILAEPDGASTTITATSPDCGAGTPTFTNSFQLSTVAEIVVDDAVDGIIAFDQDGARVARLAQGTTDGGLTYNSESNFLVALSGFQSPITFSTFTPSGTAIGSGTFTPHNTPGDSAAANEPAENIVYDPANNEYFFALESITNSNSVMTDGAIEEYSISGSTATYVNATTYGTADPAELAMLGNGNFVVNDFSGADTYIFTDTLTPAANIAQSTFGPAYDSTRGTIIAGTSASNEPNTETIFSQSLDPLTNFTYPAEGIGFVSAYSPGNDEFYFFVGFEPAYADGLAGSTLDQGGSMTSNLQVGSFDGLDNVNQAVALP